MKKVFLFLLASMTLASCGSDDGDGGGKMPSNVNIGGDGTSLNYAFAFDSKNRMISMTKTGDDTGSAQFSYGENGKVSSVTATSGGNTSTTTFQYGSDKKLTSITPEGSPAVTVTWINETSFTLDGATVRYSSKGDLEQFDTVVLSHANAKKGPFASVKAFDPFVLALADLQTVLFASKQPISNIISGGSFAPVNTFDGGYLSNSTITANGQVITINVNYN